MISSLTPVGVSAKDIENASDEMWDEVDAGKSCALKHDKVISRNQTDSKALFIHCI